MHIVYNMVEGCLVSSGSSAGTSMGSVRNTGVKVVTVCVGMLCIEVDT